MNNKTQDLDQPVPAVHLENRYQTPYNKAGIDFVILNGVKSLLFSIQDPSLHYISFKMTNK